MKVGVSDARGYQASPPHPRLFNCILKCTLWVVVVCCMAWHGLLGAMFIFPAKTLPGHSAAALFTMVSRCSGETTLVNLGT